MPSTASQCELPAGVDADCFVVHGFGFEPTAGSAPGAGGAGGAPSRPRPPPPPALGCGGACECQPVSVLPSNRSCHPWAFSCAVNVFVVWAESGDHMTSESTASQA